MNQKVALRLLEQLGYRADVAWNGLEALDALERRPYDVVLMDVQMPELDGLDASRQICARWPPETRPRIIAMTANALPEDREACFAAGMDDYVAKPIRPEELARGAAAHAPSDQRSRRRERRRTALDTSAVQSLRELGGDEFLAEVIDTFLGDAPALLATLRASLERGEAEVLRRTAHTLKSNGADPRCRRLLRALPGRSSCGRRTARWTERPSSSSGSSESMGRSSRRSRRCARSPRHERLRPRPARS